MSNIHPTAVIEDGAQIAASAKIGPFCVIGSKAKIGENVQLIAHVTIMNDTTIGDGTIVFPGAVLGGGPQDHGNEFQPEAKLVIGKNNIIRENVTMQWRHAERTLYHHRRRQRHVHGQLPRCA